MKTILRRWFSLLSAVLFVGISLTACSDENIESADWRSELTSHEHFIPQPGADPITGTFFEYAGFSIKIIDKNTGRDLLDEKTGNVRNSDFYFETNGFQYHLGDKIGSLAFYPEAKNSVSVYSQHYGGYNYLACYYLSPYYSYTNLLDKAPIDFTVDFVWPSKGIRKTIRTYIEFNKNFNEDVLKSEPNDRGLLHAWLYKDGYWVDGISTLAYDVQPDGSYMENVSNQVLIIPVDSSK